MKAISQQQLKQVAGGYYFPGNTLPNGQPVNPRARTLLIG